MMEQWHPLGAVGVITAFNFPVAVWAWNAAIAPVCGDTVVWKPSPLTPLTAIAVQGSVERVAADVGCAGGVQPVRGRADEVGELLLGRPAGAAGLGHRVSAGWAGRSAEVVGRRFGRALLELGGNNAVIVTPSADLELAVRAIVFAAVGHGRPALHDVAAADRARVGARRVGRADRRGLPQPADRRPAGRRHAGGPADPRDRGR